MDTLLFVTEVFWKLKLLLSSILFIREHDFHWKHQNQDFCHTPSTLSKIYSKLQKSLKNEDWVFSYDFLVQYHNNSQKPKFFGIVKRKIFDTKLWHPFMVDPNFRVRPMGRRDFELRSACYYFKVWKPWMLELVLKIFRLRKIIVGHFFFSKCGHWNWSLGITALLKTTCLKKLGVQNPCILK